ncbi:hypothetical protein BKA62DRAFT_111349 [Auriculariales sp. MPI-PUGE-AT-0066]|nr:hypothetical protein BKA62DRAFT_111349 [Auriculariales sp. MPI-PUGE-AT-0066]
MAAEMSEMHSHVTEHNAAPSVASSLNPVAIPAVSPPPVETVAPPSSRELPAIAPAANSHKKGIIFDGYFILLVVVAYLIFVACYSVWTYYYFITHFYPYPTRFINSGKVRWMAFKAFMVIFGIICSCGSLVALPAVAVATDSLFDALPRFWLFQCFKWLCTVVLINSAFNLAAILPFISLILMEPVHDHIYDHACNGWQLQAVLNSQSVANGSTLRTRGTVTFYTAQRREPRFEFNLGEDYRSFYLNQSLNNTTTHAGSIPLLQRIYYDLNNYTGTFPDYYAATEDFYSVRGTCYNDTLCLRGEYDPAKLRYDLYYNRTIGQHSTPIHSTVQREQGPEWRHPQLIPPAVQFRSSNDVDQKERAILRTDLTKHGDCTKLKACLAITEIVGGEDTIGPDVLVPLGALMIAHASYRTVYCR